MVCNWPKNFSIGAGMIATLSPDPILKFVNYVNFILWATVYTQHCAKLSRV